MVAIFLVMVVGISTTSYAAELKFTCHQAEKADLPDIVFFVKSMSNYPKDLAKIALLPSKFVPASLCSAIQQDYIFIARNSFGNVIGYKKMFQITNWAHVDNILKNELHCVGKNRIFLDFATISYRNNKILREVHSYTEDFELRKSDFFMYTGGDYTTPAFRNQGVCSTLYEYALRLMLLKLKSSDQPYQRIVLLYGLAAENDLMQEDGKSRTFSIVTHLLIALQQNKIKFFPEMVHYRFKSMMPRFVEQNGTYIPVFDETNMSKTGNMVFVSLVRDNSGICSAKL